MKTAKILMPLVLALCLLACLASISQAEPMGSAFTYQGHLYDNNDVANDEYDFQFKLFDDANVIDANQIGSDVNVPDVGVIDGYFTVELDFGGVFDGNACYLEIGVRPGELEDHNEYTTLSSRQQVTSTPYALYALSGNEGPQGPEGASPFVLDGNDAYYLVGNVGIGTPSPTEKLEIDGTVKADNFLGDGTQLMGVQRKHTGAIYRWNTFRIWGAGQYAMGNTPVMFGGIRPSDWTNGWRAFQMSTDKEVLRTLYTRKGYGGKNAMVVCEHANQYSSTSDAQFATVLFRIKNTTASTINWIPYFFYTASGSHGDFASATLNGADSWTYGGNIGLNGFASIVLPIPPNRTSTAIFVSSAYYWGSFSGGWFRDIQLGFYNNCLELPAGLEFVDDLDTATGGWEQ